MTKLMGWPDNGDEAVWARMRELMDECRAETEKAESAR